MTPQPAELEDLLGFVEPLLAQVGARMAAAAELKVPLVVDVAVAPMTVEAALLFEAAKRLYGLYLTHFTSVEGGVGDAKIGAAAASFSPTVPRWSASSIVRRRL